MSEYDISAKITYDTSGATAAIGQTTKALGDNAKATKSAAEATTAASTNVAQFGSTVGLVGQTVGRFNGSLGSVVSSAGAALGAVQAMTTAGLGPLGLAIGIVTTTVGLASAAFAIFKDRQNQSEASTRALNRALDDNAASLDTVISKMRERDNLAAQRSRLASGEGTSEEYRGQAETARERLRLLQGEFGDSPAMDAARSRMMAEIRALEDRADAIERGGPSTEVTIEDLPMLTGAEAQAEGRRLRNGGRSARGGGGRAAAAAAPDTREADQQREQWAADDLARITEEMDAEAEVRSRMRALEIDEANDAKDRAIEIAQEQRDAILEIKRQEAEELAAIQTGVAGGFAVLSDAMQLAAESSGASAETQKRIMAGAALAEAVVMGALEVARAAASYPDVAGMVAHGTAAAAFGVAAVKAGMTMGGAGASGGGGGAPSAPTGGPSLSSGERERGGDTIVINWGSQGLVYAADRAQLGRDLEDMIGEGRSRLGRAA